MIQIDFIDVLQGGAALLFSVGSDDISVAFIFYLKDRVIAPSASQFLFCVI